MFLEQIFALRANMLVLRTSNFQGATITPIVPRHKHSNVFIVHFHGRVLSIWVFSLDGHYGLVVFLPG